MKILYVIEYYYPHIGGAETLFKTLAEGMAERGHIVTVLTNHIDNSKREEILNGVKIKRLKFPKPKRFFFTFFSFPFILSYGKRADIIHSSTYGGVFSSSLSSLILKKLSILSVHEIWLEKWKNVSLISSFQKYTGAFQEWILLNLPFGLKVTESQYTLDRLNKIIRGKGIKIPAGISVPENLKWNKKRGEIFKFLYFGRPGHWRGVDILIYAFCEVIKIIKNLKLILVLSEEPKREFEEIKILIEKLKLSNFIEIKKPFERDELFRFLMEVDAVVIPSISEGFGLSAAEACALSVPVISSKAGSLPEVVSGKCLFFEPGNTIDLKEKMISAYNDKWEFIERKDFSKESFISKWEEIYMRFGE